MMHPKPFTLVSQRLRDSAEGKPCTLRWPGCDGGGDTTVLAHLRQWGGAGIAQKPDDTFAVYACASCHDQLDYRTTEAQRVDLSDVLRALRETQNFMLREGLLIVGKEK